MKNSLAITATAIRQAWRCGLARLLLAVAILLVSLPVAAAVPTTIALEGLLTSTGGGPAADGVYPASFQLLDGAAGATVWSEGPLNITVKGGTFAVALGAKTPLTSTVLVGDRWLSVQFASDPALPSVPLRSVPYAVRGQVAEGLDCSGCIKPGQLDPAVLQGYAKTADLSAYVKAVDLSGYAKTADLADYVKSASLAQVAGTGSYKDLTDTPVLADVAKSGQFGDLLGIPTLAKVNAACGTGLVMRGIKADGSYDCVAAMDATSLPKDALKDVSNGLLTNVFKEVAPSTKVPIDIADGLPAGVSDAIDVPDFGVAQKLEIYVKLSNSDISKVRVTVFDPAGQAYKLYDQGGTGVALEGTWPTANKTISGDLTAWIGKNPKGIWSINVADLAGTNGKLDGKLLAWTVNVQILSSKKVAATGGLQLAVTDTAPVACQSSTFGMMYASATDKAVYVCNGISWYPISITAIGTKESPAASCKDLLTKAPLSKSGVYWIDPDGLGGTAPYDVYCEMNLAGGGWTLLLNLDSGDAAMHHYGDTDFWTTAKLEGSSDKALTTGHKSMAFSTLSGANETMVLAHDNGQTKGWSVYDLGSNNKGQSLMYYMANGSDLVLTGTRKQGSGTVGATLNTKRSQTEYGDPFIDHAEALVVNKQSGWTAQVNKNRLSTTLSNGLYSHTLGGLGGNHVNSGWGDIYESAPIASYCDWMNLYGSAANYAPNGQGNSLATTGSCADSGGQAKWLPIDIAIFYR